MRPVWHLFVYGGRVVLPNDLYVLDNVGILALRLINNHILLINLLLHFQNLRFQTVHSNFWKVVVYFVVHGFEHSINFVNHPFTISFVHFIIIIRLMRLSTQVFHVFSVENIHLAYFAVHLLVGGNLNLFFQFNLSQYVASLGLCFLFREVLFFLHSLIKQCHFLCLV